VAALLSNDHPSRLPWQYDKNGHWEEMMVNRPPTDKPDLMRRALLTTSAAAAVMPHVAFAQGTNSIRIGVPTRTYWPTIVCETAIRQKLFEKEGIKAELTIYRSGAEGFEALAAGATDLVLNSSSSVAAGLKKGVNVRCLANGANGYYGWYLVVKSDSPLKQVSELAGKKVGITSAGSGSDICARWTLAEHKLEFTRVPLGGGGLVPNLLTGNIDATVLYSPLTYKVIDEKVARPIIDYGAAIPAHSNSSWIASDKFIAERPEVAQKALNAIYGGLGFLCTDANRAAAVKLIAEIDEIPETIAARELDGNIKNLSRTGEFQLEWMERALDMARLIGMSDLTSAKEIYIEKFRPVPTQA
jgi:NitT/TauT family transport system substrate-binding protein